MSWLLGLLDYFLPAGMRTNPSDLMRGYIFIGLCASNILVCIIMLLVLFFFLDLQQNTPIGTALNLVCRGGNSLALFLFKRSENLALASFMKSYGNLINAPEMTLGAYFHQCAIEMNCRQLALAGLYLTNAPGTPRMLGPDRVRRINAIMMTCGHYDASGDFAFRVGLPGKSGVGGGILCIVPGRASVAVWSPGLNAQGNSQLGTEAIERLASEMGWSVFGASHTASPEQGQFTRVQSPPQRSMPSRRPQTDIVSPFR